MATRIKTCQTEPSLDLEEPSPTPVLTVAPNTFPAGDHCSIPSHAYSLKPQNSSLLSENTLPGHAYREQDTTDNVLPRHAYSSTNENSHAHDHLSTPSHAYGHGHGGPYHSLPGHAYQSLADDSPAFSGHAYEESTQAVIAPTRSHTGSTLKRPAVPSSLAFSPPFRRISRSTPLQPAVLISRPKLCCSLYRVTPTYGNNYDIICLRGKIQPNLKGAQKGDLGAFFRWAFSLSPTYLQRDSTYTMVELIDYSRPSNQEHQASGRPNPEYYAVLRDKDSFARIPYQYGFGRADGLTLLGSVLVTCQAHKWRMWEANFLT